MGILRKVEIIYQPTKYLIPNSLSDWVIHGLDRVKG